MNEEPKKIDEKLDEENKENRENKENKEDKKDKDFVNEYECFRYCRCCPFPGLKCIGNGKAHK